MKRVYFAFLLVGILFSGGPALAVPQTIVDGFWGGTPTDGVPRDIVGPSDKYDVEKLEVDFVGGKLTLAIHTRYVNSIGDLGTELGDLFISTNGWAPFGVAPYPNDDVSNGEDWELVAVLDDHTGATKSGQLSVYGVIPANVVLSHLSDTFRKDQEVQYAPGQNEQPLYQGTWEIVDVPATDYDTLVFSIDFGNALPSNFLDNAGFHWTMTCANDVIEGGTVPEPMSLALLGGALAVAPLRRRFRRA